MGKLSIARWVWAPHLASRGTRTSPMESFSTRWSWPVVIGSLAPQDWQMGRSYGSAEPAGRSVIGKTVLPRSRLARWLTVPEFSGGLASSLVDRHGDYGRAIGTQFRPGVGHVRRVEAHTDHRVSPASPRRFEHAIHHFVPALRQVLGHALELPADDRLQAGTHLGEGVPRPHRQTEHLTDHTLDLPPRDFIRGRDQHVRALSRVPQRTYRTEAWSI